MVRFLYAREDVAFCMLFQSSIPDTITVRPSIVLYDGWVFIVAWTCSIGSLACALVLDC